MKAVYKMTIGNEFYIGQTFNYDERISNHIRKLKRGAHENKRIQALYNNTRNISFEVLFSGDVTRNVLCDKENQFILELKPTLNISVGGLGGGTGTHKTEVQKQHLRDINLGSGNPMYGKPAHNRIAVIGTNCDDGSEIEFDTITDAAKYVNGDFSSIAKAIRNNINKPRYGYVWRKNPVSTIHGSVE